MAGEAVRFGKPDLVRFSVNPTQSTVTTRLLGGRRGELPTVHPNCTGRPYTFVWSTVASDESGSHLYTGIQKLNVATGESTCVDLAPDLPGEALFVPRPNATAEDDGWVLTLVYRSDAHRSDLVVLDAATLETRCILPLPHHVPLGFHSTWVEAASL